MQDEVRYNLLHLLSGLPEALRLKAADDSLLFAQTPGHNAWLWLDPALDGDAMQSRLAALAERLAGGKLPGATGDPGAVLAFAAKYAAAEELAYSIEMTLVPYACPAAQPADAPGEARLARHADRRLVAEWLAGFSSDAYGEPVRPVTQLPSADRLITGGQLFIWEADGKPVSMANIAHRSPRHGRINAVYTPPSARKRGYASALVASLSRALEREGRAPMLYADRDNPDSNSVYRRVGFEPHAPIVELKFRERD